MKLVYQVARALLWTALILGTSLTTACGPIPPPENPYRHALDLMRDARDLRSKASSFRIRGRVDNVADRQWVAGKVYLFGLFPERLRVEVVSPLGTPFSVLTSNGDEFSLHDIQSGRFWSGPAKPCNIARILQVPMTMHQE